MAETRLTTDASDVDRWSAEIDVVPVKDGESLRIVPSGEATLDQERMHWDEFHAERAEDTVVARSTPDDGRPSLSLAKQEAVLDRLDLSADRRREIESRLADGETVTIPDQTVLDVERVGAQGEAGERVSPANFDRTRGWEGDDRRTPEDRDVGKTVVTAGGDEVGMIKAVREDVFFVDPHPGLTDTALATLGWTSADDEDVRVEADRIDRITPDVVRLVDDAEEVPFRETTAGH